MRIWYRLYQFVTTRYTTDFYIIKALSLSTTHRQYNETVIQIYTYHLNLTLHRFLLNLLLSSFLQQINNDRPARLLCFPLDLAEQE